MAFSQPRESRLKTYAPALARQLANESHKLKPAAHAAPTAAAEDMPLSSSWEQRKAAQRAALEAKARHKEELFRAAMERKRAAEAAGREAHFQQLYSEVLGGLEHGSGVLSDAQEVLQYAEAAQQAQKEELYQQWHSQVFEPIQARIREAMSQRSIRDLEASLQAASDAYVQATNTKRLFLDVVIADDYNPMAPLARSIRVPTADLQDPLLHDLIKTQTEKNLLNTGTGRSSSSMTTGSSKHGSRTSSPQQRTSSPRPGSRTSSPQQRTTGSRSSSRQQAGQLTGWQPEDARSSGTAFGLAKATTRPVLDTTRWAAGQIHATPYGHCIDNATAQYIVKPAAPLSLAQKASHVFFDDFTPC